MSATAELLADYDRARDLDPDAAAFDLSLLGLPREAVSPKAQLELLSEAIRRAPDLALLRVERAELLRSPAFCRYEEALEEYRRAEVLAPQRAWIQAHMARAEGQVRGLNAGLARLERAAALSPESGWIRAWRGESLRRLGREDEALSEFDAAIARMPGYGYAHAWRGALLASRGLWAEAAQALDRALAIGLTYPADAAAYFQRSLARRALGEMAGAVADLTRAFQLDPKHVWDGPDGLDVLLASEPRNAWAWAWRGRLLRSLGDLSRALELDGTNALAWAWRAELQTDNAARQADLEQALQLEPRLWQAALALAEIVARAGRAAEALALLERAQTGAGASAAFYFQKAELALELGRASEALEDLKKAVGLDRGFRRARELLERVRASLETER